MGFAAAGLLGVGRSKSRSGAMGFGDDGFGAGKSSSRSGTSAGWALVAVLGAGRSVSSSSWKPGATIAGAGRGAAPLTAGRSSTSVLCVDVPKAPPEAELGPVAGLVEEPLSAGKSSSKSLPGFGAGVGGKPCSVGAVAALTWTCAPQAGQRILSPAFGIRRGSTSYGAPHASHLTLIMPTRGYHGSPSKSHDRVRPQRTFFVPGGGRKLDPRGSTILGSAGARCALISAGGSL